MFFNGLYLAALLLASPWLVYRSWKTKRYRNGWSEKWLGKVPPLNIKNRQTYSPEPKVFWLHAVSVGEVQVLRTVIKSLLIEWPNAKIAISTTTQTGMELAKHLYLEHHVFYMPMDFTWAVRQTLSRIRPDWLLLAELEVWPNLIRLANSSKCQVAVINGRLSENSFKGYCRIVWLLRPSFQRLSFVGAQDKTYAHRFVSMGVATDRVHVTGSLKFDGANPDLAHPEIVKRRVELAIPVHSLVWVAGSTQAPEEELILRAFAKIRSHERFKRLRLILVPRHPERGDEISRSIDSTGFRTIQRSKLLAKAIPSDKTKSTSDDWDILLGDTIGELRWWWGIATLAFVGGSFGNRGGQNMIEPVAYGVPTAVGPNTRNFKDIMRILGEANAVKVFESPEEIELWVMEMLDNVELRAKLGKRGMEVTREHRGATERTVRLLNLHQKET